MPTAVASTGSWRNESSTNSSLSAEKLRIASTIVTPRVAKRPTAPASHYGCGGCRGCAVCRSAGFGHVRRLTAALAGDDIELDPFALVQRAKARALDRGEVDEDVLARAVGDETEALGLVEPLD